MLPFSRKSLPPPIPQVGTDASSSVQPALVEESGTEVLRSSTSQPVKEPDARDTLPGDSTSTLLNGGGDFWVIGPDSKSVLDVEMRDPNMSFVGHSSPTADAELRTSPRSRLSAQFPEHTSPFPQYELESDPEISSLEMLPHELVRKQRARKHLGIVPKKGLQLNRVRVRGRLANEDGGKPQACRYCSRMRALGWTRDEKGNAICNYCDWKYRRFDVNRHIADDETETEMPIQKHPILAHVRDEVRDVGSDDAAHSTERTPTRGGIPEKIGASSSGRLDILTTNSPLPTVEADPGSEDVEMHGQCSRAEELAPSICGFSSDQGSSQGGDQESLMSRDEILTFGQRLRAHKTRLIGDVLENILCRLDGRFISMQHGGGTSASYPIGDAGVGASQSSKGRQVERKRKFGKAGGSAEDSEDNAPEERNPKRLESLDPAELLLACPFFKHDIARYKAHRACCGPGWDTVHRIKEHVYRKHRQPRHRCNRCYWPFEDNESLVEHQRSATPCELQNSTPVDGIDETQERLLRCRKKTGTGLGEIGKWRAMYKIIFPDVAAEDIPSPFYEYEKIYEKDAEGKGRSEYFAEYKKYLIPRLRSRLEQQFETDLRIFESGMKKKAIDLVIDVQLEILHEFRKRTPGTSHQTEPRLEAESATSSHRTMATMRSENVQLSSMPALEPHDFQLTYDDLGELDFLNPFAFIDGNSGDGWEWDETAVGPSNSRGRQTSDPGYQSQEASHEKPDSEWDERISRVARFSYF